MATELLTGVGRLVQGSCFRANTKKDDAGKDVLNEAGQPITSYYIGVAFKKDDQDFLGRIYPAILAEARAGYPEHFNPDGSCRLRNFAFKVMDGDGVDDNGKSNAEKPGFAGHWVLKCSSSFAPQVYHKDNYDPMHVVRDENALRLGYYVRVSISLKGNRPSKSPGVYVNFNVVEITAQCPPDQIIVTGPDARQIFGGAPAPQLPAGAIQGGPGVNAPGAPGGAQPSGPAPMAPRSPIAMAVAPPTFTMTASAQGFTREQYHAQGWTDDALVAQGMMVSSAPQQLSAPAAPSMPPGPVSAAPSAPAPATVIAPSSPSNAPPAPNANFVANAIATPIYTMTAAAQGFTREQYNAQGWTDDVLIAQGKMVKQ